MEKGFQQCVCVCVCGGGGGGVLGSTILLEVSIVPLLGETILNASYCHVFKSRRSAEYQLIKTLPSYQPFHSNVNPRTKKNIFQLDDIYIFFWLRV